MAITDVTVPVKYVKIQATTPTDLTEGRLWYNTTDNKTYVSDGSSYGALGSIYVYRQATTPDDLTEGMLWYNTDDGKIYSSDGINYNIIKSSADKYRISDDLALSWDAEIIIDAPSQAQYYKATTITLSMPLGTDTIRIKFSVDSDFGAGNSARIYKNGTAFGAEQSFGTTYTTLSEDLEFSDGDTLEIWLKPSVDGYSLKMKELRIYGYGSLNANINGEQSTP